MSRMDALKEVVAPAILQRAASTSNLLRELGIPHALIGGLAVGVHGHARATKDVDFLVGEGAFLRTTPFLLFRDELKDLVRIGETDLMGVPTSYPGLAQELRLEEDIPVISLRGLVLMKLDANRAKDQEDVRVLLRQYPTELRGIRDYLQTQAPPLVIRFAELVASLEE